MEDDFELPDFRHIPLKFDPPSIHTGSFNSLINEISEIEKKVNDSIRLVKQIGIDMEEGEHSEGVTQVEKDLKAILDQHKILSLYKTQAGLTRDVIRDSRGLELQDSIAKACKEQVDQDIKKYLKSSERRKYATNEHYIDFKKSVFAVKHAGEIPDIEENLAGTEGEDDEIRVTTQKEILRCPISTEYLEDAVINVLCNHSYSKNNITTYIQRKRGSARCPVAGCNQPVSASNLKRNDELQQRVNKAIERLEMEEQNEDENREATFI